MQLRRGCLRIHAERGVFLVFFFFFTYNFLHLALKRNPLSASRIRCQLGHHRRVFLSKTGTIRGRKEGTNDQRVVSRLFRVISSTRGERELEI